jgi:preprotein translocase subunit SecE
VESIRKLRSFFEDVWKELKRTSFPSKKEVYGTTLVVVVAVLIVAVYLGVVDYVLAFLQRQFLIR